MRRSSLSEAAPHLKCAYSPILPEGVLIGEVCPPPSIFKYLFHWLTRYTNWISLELFSAYYSTQHLRAQHCKTKSKAENPTETFNDQAYSNDNGCILPRSATMMYLYVIFSYLLNDPLVQNDSVGCL